MIELKWEFVAGHERVAWVPTRSIRAKEVEFTEPEAVRIRAAVETWNSYGAAADQRWQEPLIRILVSTDRARDECCHLASRLACIQSAA